MYAMLDIEHSRWGGYWTLCLFDDNGDPKSAFFLGQDVKVCSRLLGESPAELASAIGRHLPLYVNDDQVCKDIAQHILDVTGLTPEALLDLEPWDLAVE